MGIDIRVHAGSDDAFIAWTSEFIPDCRGFALRRRVKRGPNNIVSSRPILCGILAVIDGAFTRKTDCQPASSAAEFRLAACPSCDSAKDLRLSTQGYASVITISSLPTTFARGMP